MKIASTLFNFGIKLILFQILTCDWNLSNSGKSFHESLFIFFDIPTSRSLSFDVDSSKGALFNLAGGGFRFDEDDIFCCDLIYFSDDVVYSI